MPTQAPSAPLFVASLLGDTDAAAKILEQVHPDYRQRMTSWRVLLDAFEGSGGFLDGGYLWMYPREDAEGYIDRQKWARYHNYLEGLVDLYVRFVFTNGVKRSANSEDYNAWIENVDGANTHLTDLLKRLLSVALVHGHAGCLVDMTREAPIDATKAGIKAHVVANVFTALAIPDWRFDATLSAVKLYEAPPDVGIAEEPDPDAMQYLLWDRTGWARFSDEGEFLAADTPELGLVPFVVLRPKPSYVSGMTGRPLVSNANVVLAMFNRASEEDNVIRDQAFSVLTVSVPEGGNVSQAKEQLGSVIGTAKALVVQGTIDYKTPDQTVPATIRENTAYLVQELYRAAHVRFRSESLAGESAETIRLQYTELNESLQGIAKALTEAEQRIARAYFAWTTATPELGQAAYEAAAVEVEYPSEFFLDALITDLEAWAEAVRMDLGPLMTKRIKKRAVRRIDTEMSPEDLAAIDAEIDAMPDEDPRDAGMMDTGDPEADALAQAERDANTA